ncbi:MAG: hypothetical protein R3275_00425 [Saprospiraceae bacterium]|nr:hypothetical protein [Saprospiraceae bacterium]
MTSSCGWSQLMTDLSLLTTIPHSSDDNIQPRLGVMLLGHVVQQISQEVYISGGLGIGNTKSDIQYLASGNSEFWEDTREELYYLRSELSIAIKPGKSNPISFEIGPGLEYIFFKQYNGTWLLDPLEDGSPPLIRKELKEKVQPFEKIRFVLSGRLLYNADVYGRSVQIGPYFDYADSHAVINEVSSRKFGFYMAIELTKAATTVH